MMGIPDVRRQTVRFPVTVKNESSLFTFLGKPFFNYLFCYNGGDSFISFFISFIIFHKSIIVYRYTGCGTCQDSKYNIVRHKYYPLSYGVPVRERYGSTLLPATTAARPKLYTKSLTRDLKLMYSPFTLVRISIKL